MKVISVFIFLFIFLFLPLIGDYSLAASQSITIINLPKSLDQSQEFELDVVFSCPGCSDSYLRGVFYPSGTGYFGYTKDNSGNWVNASGSSCNLYYKITEAELNKDGTWSGKLRFKPDKDNASYKGPGEYLFKIGRYTPSCSSPSVWSLESTISITGPTPTLSPMPTSTPSNTPTLTPTIKPLPTNTPTVSPKITNNPTEIPSLIASNSSSPQVLGQKDSLFSIPKDLNEKDKNIQTFSSFDRKTISTILIFTGVVFMFLCAIVILYPKVDSYIKSKFNTDEKQDNY